MEKLNIIDGNHEYTDKTVQEIGELTEEIRKLLHQAFGEDVTFYVHVVLPIDENRHKNVVVSDMDPERMANYGSELMLSLIDSLKTPTEEKVIKH